MRMHTPRFSPCHALCHLSVLPGRRPSLALNQAVSQNESLFFINDPILLTIGIGLTWGCVFNFIKCCIIFQSDCIIFYFHQQ